MGQAPQSAARHIAGGVQQVAWDFKVVLICVHRNAQTKAVYGDKRELIDCRKARALDPANLACSKLVDVRLVAPTTDGVH